ncbi:unnamed protein product [Ectocarpus sp. 6 AP-2014]
MSEFRSRSWLPHRAPRYSRGHATAVVRVSKSRGDNARVSGYTEDRNKQQQPHVVYAYKLLLSRARGISQHNLHKVNHCCTTTSTEYQPTPLLPWFCPLAQPMFYVSRGSDPGHCQTRKEKGGDARSIPDYQYLYPRLPWTTSPPYVSTPTLYTGTVVSAQSASITAVMMLNTGKGCS